MPGVIDVVTGLEVAHLRPGAYTYSDEPDEQQPVLPASSVNFVGEPVAAVVANTEAQAIDAVERVVVDFEPEPPAVTMDQALASGRILDHARIPAPHDSAVFANCDIVVTQASINPRQSPAPIEPRSMACMWSLDGHLHIWAATQRPHGFKDQLAETYAMDRERIHVTTPAVGGAFGGKVSRTPEEHLLPELSRRVRRPVRWTETRSEYFLAATQGRGEHVNVTLAGDADGRFAAIRVELVKDAGAYPSVGSILAATYGKAACTSVYDIPYAEFDATAVSTNLPPVSAFRGAGRAPIVAAIERTVDIYAQSAGIDPAELRRRNLVPRSAMPYRTATGSVLDEADYAATLEQALAAVGYGQCRAEQLSRRRAGSSVALGIGIGCYNHMTVGYAGEEASVAIQPDGSVLIATGSTSQGHSHATTWAQLASDVLAIPIESITVVEGSTDAVASGQGAVASRSAQTAGVAVNRLSRQLVERASRLAADHLEAAQGDIVLARSGEPGFHVAGTPTARVSWARLAADHLHSDNELTCGEFYDADGRLSFPSGCQIAVVEVDTDTGHVAIRRYVAADDAGPRLNPMVVEGQLHGGIAAGAAQVLGERMHYDDHGVPLTANFADYALGSIDQFPRLQIMGEDHTVPSSFNELGVKGVGESGTVGAIPAVHNAIIDALHHLGIRHMDIPCTPNRIWSAISKARSPDSG